MKDELLQTIRGILAQAYCLPQHSHKEMDATLCLDQAEAILTLIRKREILARIDEIVEKLEIDFFIRETNIDIRLEELKQQLKRMS
jgi:hypothetical protein